jgi:hypothetical protein
MLGINVGLRKKCSDVALLLLSVFGGTAVAGNSLAADGQPTAARAERGETPFFADTAPAAAPAKPAAAPAKPVLAKPKKDKGEKTKLLKKRCPAKVPATLDPAEDATLELALSASGAQIYVCAAAKPNEAPIWTLEAPHALLTQAGQIWATHFAGPSWQWLDGSLVKGAKLASADAPVKSAMPWLLLSATPTGEGAFGQITQIQRLDTEGGKAPESGCDAAHVAARVLVPYRANYYFYRKRAEGENVRQCHSKAEKKKSS